MEYRISLPEISRRKKAYIAFSISLIAGFFIWSLVFNFPLPPFIYLLLIFAMFLIGLFSFVVLNKLLKTKLVLTENGLTRVANKVSEDYPLDKIKAVKIEWTTNRTIREIYIYLKDNKSIFISALDNMTGFKKDLLTRIEKTVAIKEIKELMDYDSSFFYPLLGLVISAASLLTFRFLSTLMYQYIKVAAVGFSIYLFALSIYFISAKPLSKSYGDKSVISDYIFGVVLTVLGGIMLYFKYCAY
jgi:uncharacterized membrane protein